MMDFSSILVGIAGLAALGLVLLAHDWREEYRLHREEKARRGAPRHLLRDWLRHRH